MMSEHEHPQGLRVPRLERPKTVKEQVYLVLRERLMLGSVKPNARILEKELTEQLGVSRTPVRDALTRLAHEGLLIATHYGYNVPSFGPNEVEQLFELRLLLEPRAAWQAAGLATDLGLDDMRCAIAEEQRAHQEGRLEDFIKAHTEFREAWLGRVCNPLLCHALRPALHSLHLIRGRTLSSPEIRTFLIRAHHDLLEAIEAGQNDLAEKKQREAISGFKELAMSHLFPS